MFELYGNRFTYETFIQAQQAAVYFALQNGKIPAGAAGQIPFYAAAGNTLTPQGPFAAGLPIIGNGASGLAAGTKSGTGAFLTVMGSLTSGDCLSASAGSAIDAGGPCSIGGGGGTVSAASKGQKAVYNASSNVVVGVTECVPIETFGGGTGASGATNVTAFNAVVAAFGSSGGCISFGPGVYQFNTQVSVTFPTSNPWTIAVRGVGHDVTTLEWTASVTDGILFSLSKNGHGFYVSDLTIATGVANGGNGIAATCLFAVSAGNCAETFAHKSIENVTFKGMDGPNGTDYWNVGFSNTGVTQININNVDFLDGAPQTGVGILHQGYATGSSYAFSLLVSNSNFNNIGIGISLKDFWQGVLITNSNFGGGTDILQSSGATATLSNLSVTNSQFTILAVGIDLLSPVFEIGISNNYFLVGSSNGVGFACNPCSGGTIVGNIFTSGAMVTQAGIDIIANASIGVIISSNVFNSLATGMIVNGTTAPINIQSNIYQGVPTKIANGGTVQVGGSCAGIGGTCTAGATN